LAQGLKKDVGGKFRYAVGLQSWVNIYICCSESRISLQNTRHLSNRCSIEEIDFFQRFSLGPVLCLRTMVISCISWGYKWFGLSPHNPNCRKYYLTNARKAKQGLGRLLQMFVMPRLPRVYDVYVSGW